VIEKIRPEEDFSFVKGSGAFPTVEVDAQSLEEAGIDFYLDEVCKALEPIKGNKRPTTIYVLESPSFNFGQAGHSYFIGVAGTEKSLALVGDHFKSLDGVNSRYSEYIPASRASKAVHVEMGEIWVPHEEDSWIAFSFTEQPVLEDSSEEDIEVDEFDIADLLNEMQSNDLEEIEKVTKPLRVRAARKDASVGSVRKTIERIFGLPEGSVLLCGPDRVVLRSDARIGTLRKRWE
jgi:hypothetical protein